MPKIRLTKTAAETLKFSGKQEEYYDTKLTGFGIRINQDSKTYFCRARVRKGKGINQQVKEPIGRTDLISFDKAETIAKQILADAANGISPNDRREQKVREDAEHKRQEEAEAYKDVTLREVFKLYKETKKKIRASTVALYEQHLETHLSDWLDLPIRSITPDMVVRRHTQIGKKYPATADGTMRVFRAICNFAINAYDEILYKNPAKRLSVIGAWYMVDRRKNFIKPDQLKMWFEGVFSLKLPGARDALQIFIFTGLRKNELLMLKWEDVHLQKGVIELPPHMTKAGRGLEIPICQYVIDILKERHRLYFNGPESYVFPSYGKKGHLADIRSAGGKVKGVDFTPHDLRRSFISYCEALRVPIFTMKRLVNHALPKDVTEGYVQFHIEDLRQTVETVAEYILRHAGIKPTNVIPMRKAGGE